MGCNGFWVWRVLVAAGGFWLLLAGSGKCCSIPLDSGGF